MTSKNETSRSNIPDNNPKIIIAQTNSNASLSKQSLTKSVSLDEILEPNQSEPSSDKSSEEDSPFIESLEIIDNLDSMNISKKVLKTIDSVKSSSPKKVTKSISANLSPIEEKRFGRIRTHLSESSNEIKAAPLAAKNVDSIKMDSDMGLGNIKRNRSGSNGKDIHPILTLSNKRTIYTAGRPPWYNVDGGFKEAFMIGICGGSGSGKTTVAKAIIEDLQIPWVVLLSMDCFYKNLSEDEIAAAARNEWNFDAPHSFDLDVCYQMLKKLKAGKPIECPQYDFTTHRRRKQTTPIYGANVIIFEGILSMCDERVRDLMDLKIFVDTDSDIRLARRLRRDIKSRGRDLAGIIGQYQKFVKPAYDRFIHPLIRYADIVVPRGGENYVAINLISQQIKKELSQRFKSHRSELAKVLHENETLPPTFNLLTQSNQVLGMLTILRNRETSRDDFIFYSQRLMRLLFEFALAQLPHSKDVVSTPQGMQYNGMKFSGKSLCGVSILRAGETMENALFQVTKDIRLGKILIQTNHDNGEPELHFLRLPQNIEDEHVILMDATVATGAAALMAIRILLDYGVLQENIILVSLLMAKSGVHTVAYAYPKVKMVTSAMDDSLDENFYIVPGIGNFGDRYFGT